jgi:hypothetical protein
VLVGALGLLVGLVLVVLALLVLLAGAP